MKITLEQTTSRMQNNTPKYYPQAINIRKNLIFEHLNSRYGNYRRTRNVKFVVQLFTV